MPLLRPARLKRQTVPRLCQPCGGPTTADTAVAPAVPLSPLRSVTFTMYNHGSDWNRDKGDFEVVTFMGNRANGTEYVDFLITDGVGSVPKTQPMAGTFIPDGLPGKRPKPVGFGYETRDVKEK